MHIEAGHLTILLWMIPSCLYNIAIKFVNNLSSESPNIELGIPRGCFQLSIAIVSESTRAKNTLSLEGCRHWLSHLHPKLAIEVWPHARAISESVMSIPVGLVYTRLCTVVSLTWYTLWSGLDLKPSRRSLGYTEDTLLGWPGGQNHKITLNHMQPPSSPSYMYGWWVIPLTSTSPLPLNPQSVGVLFLSAYCWCFNCTW